MKAKLFSFIRRIYLFIQAFGALIDAWKIKTRRNLSNVKFSTSGKLKDISNREVEYLIKCTDNLVRFGAIRTGRKCFFRAYILGSVLRKWGIPVIMNVGLFDLAGDCKRHGHCWLTLNDHLFAEPFVKVERYKTKIGSGDNGICYWYGDKNASAQFS